MFHDKQTRFSPNKAKPSNKRKINFKMPIQDKLSDKNSLFFITSKVHLTCKYSVLFFPSRVVVMAGDFICLQQQFRSCFNPKTLLSQLNSFFRRQLTEMRSR